MYARWSPDGSRIAGWGVDPRTRTVQMIIALDLPIFGFLCMVAAFYLILELGMPFGGLMQLSNEPLRNALR